MSDPHAPYDQITDTETVTCARSGIAEAAGPEGEDVPVMTLGDIKAFTARLDELGAADDQVLWNDGSTLQVTLDRRL